MHKNQSIRIIPCLDVKDGRTVKGVNFVDLIDAGDPVAQAKFYNDEGADELVFLDITASHEKRTIMLDVVKKTAEQAFMPLTVGGGVHHEDDFRALLLAGADKVAVNSAAIKEPELISRAANRFGAQCVSVAVDARFNKQTQQYEVYSHGGRTATGLEVSAWIKQISKIGAGEILLTSMDRDGVKTGYDLELLKLVRGATHLPIIASGGAGSAEHMVAAIIEGKADAVLAASIFHFGVLSIRDVKHICLQAGLNMRPPISSI